MFTPIIQIWRGIAFGSSMSTRQTFEKVISHNQHMRYWLVRNHVPADERYDRRYTTVLLDGKEYFIKN